MITCVSKKLDNGFYSHIVIPIGMSQLEKSNEYYPYEQICQNLLKESEIRFAGLINPMGNLVAGGMKEGLKPLEDDADMRKL